MVEGMLRRVHMVDFKQCKPSGDVFTSGHIWMECIWSEVGREWLRHGLGAGYCKKSEARLAQKWATV